MSNSYLLKALVSAAILAAVFTGVAANAQSLGEIPSQDPSNVEIDPEIESKFTQDTGMFSFFTETEVEKVEVLVVLESYSSRPNQISEMKSRASNLQSPLLKFVEKNPQVNLRNSFWITNAALLEVDSNFPVENIAEVQGVRRLQQNSRVRTLQSDSFTSSEISSQGSTQSTDETYGLSQINTTEAWNEFGAQGENAKVAVLDTGVDIDHPDIELFTEDENDDTYPGGWAEFDDGGDQVQGSTPYDSQYHGTHVSGTVSGGDSSGTKIGVAPGTDLMNALVLDEGTGTFAQITAGMQWAVEEEADIISMSLGIACDPDSVYESAYIDEIQNAHSLNSTVIAAIGNDGEGCSSSPGNVYDSLSIGASDSNEDIRDFSSGEEVDTSEAWGADAPNDWPEKYIVPKMAAPGNETLSSFPASYCDGDPDCYAYLSGTSMATPHVSGAAALMQSATNTGLRPMQIQEAFVETAWKPSDWDESQAMSSRDGKDTRYGSGIIDAYAATEYAVENFDAGFVVRDVELNTSAVNITEPFKVTGEVENFEDQSKDVDLDLKFNETVNDSQTVSLNAGETKSFQFENNISEEGFYSVKVNGESAGGLDVLMPPPDFSVEANLQDSEIVEGEEALIDGEVVNDGGDGVADLRLKANDSELASKDLSIDFEETKSYSFTQLFDSPGEYEVKVNNTLAGTLNVLNEAELRINSVQFNVSENQTFEKEAVNISVEAENIGDVEESFDIELFADDSKINEKNEVKIPETSIETVNFTESFEDRGKYNISSGSESNILEVLKPGSVEIINSTLPADEIVEGEQAAIEAWTENPGDVDATDVLEFEEDGEKVDEKSVEVENLTQKQFSFSKQFDEPGQYNLSVNGTENHVLNVLEDAELNQTGLFVENGVEGEEFSFISEVENTGEVEGDFSINLSIIGEEEHNLSQSLTLGPGEAENATFTQVLETPGEYVAESLNMSEEFTVLKEADLSIEEVQFDPKTVFTGQNVGIEALVNNTGDLAGNSSLEFSTESNSTVVEEEIAPGETYVNQSLQMFESGNFTVSVNETTALNESEEPDILEVKKPFVNITRSSFNVSQQGLIEAEAEVNNTDPGFTTENLEFSVNETVQSTESFDLDPEERKNVSISLDWNQTGLYVLRINGSESGNFSLDPFSDFSNLSPIEETFTEDEKIRFSGNVKSVGAPNITASIAGENQSSTLEEGLDSFSFEQSFSPGSYEWYVKTVFSNSTFSSETLSFEVEEESDDDSSDSEESDDSESSDSETDSSGEVDPSMFLDPEIEIEQNSDSILVYNIYEGHKISFNDTDLPIKSLEFDAEPENGTLEFKALDNEDENVSFETSFSSESSFETNFTLAFTVSREWLEENRFEPEEVSLYGLESYGDQGAEFIERTEDKALYQVEIQDLSDYGVGVERACYSMDAVAAADSDSCEVYSTPCQVPEEREVVDSCEIHEQDQQIRERLEQNREKELNREQAERLEEAEQALDGGDRQQAEQIISEIEQQSESLFWVRPVATVLTALIFVVSLSFGSLRFYRVRKKNHILNEIGEIADVLSERQAEGEDVKQQSIQLKQANQAVKHNDYESATDKMSDIRTALKQ